MEASAISKKRVQRLRFKRVVYDSSSKTAENRNYNAIDYFYFQL